MNEDKRKRGQMSDETLWPDSQAMREEFLKKLADENGGRLERDAAGRLMVVRDLRQLLGPRGNE